MKIAEFFVTLGLDTNLPTVKEFASTLANLPLDAAGAITAIAGLDYHLVQLAKDALEAAVGFQLFTSQTGLSAQELAQWQIVAEKANVSSATMQASILSLQQKIAEIRLTGQGRGPFTFLGIDINQGPFGILQQLRTVMASGKYDINTIGLMMRQMGLDPSLINVLRMSNVEFEAITKNRLAMTAAQEAAFLKIKRAIVDVNQEIRAMAYQALRALGPWIIGALHGFVALLKDGAYFLGSIVDLIAKMPILLAAAAVTLAAMFAPIHTTIVALLLLLDDLRAYEQGAPSVMGHLFGKKGKDLTGDLHTPLGRMATGLSMAQMAVHLPPALVPLLQDMIGRMQGVIHNVEVRIHSSAPAHEVGDHAAAAIRRQIQDADGQMNRGPRG